MVLFAIRHIRNFHAQGRRQSDLVVLFLDRDVANLFGDSIFALCFALPDPLPIAIDHIRINCLILAREVFIEKSHQVVTRDALNFVNCVCRFYHVHFLYRRAAGCRESVVPPDKTRQGIPVHIPSGSFAALRPARRRLERISSRVNYRGLIFSAFTALAIP